MAQSSRLTLRRSLKKYHQGTHRICSPQETERMVLKKVRDSGLPVYFELERIDHLDKIGLPVHAVHYSDVFNNTKQAGQGTCCKGKGLSAVDSRVSALMERVERFSASDMSLKDIVFSPFRDLDNAISRWDFVPCNLQRKLYTKKEVDRQRLPWTKCFSLSHDREVMAPANLVYFRSFKENNDFSYTTGLASGNSREEAIFHGLCEVIERHLQEVIYRNGVKTPLVDIESIADENLRDLIGGFTSKGIKLHINYLSLDFQIPAFGVLGFDQAPPYFDSYSFYSSVGVHTDKTVALTRALTELAQSRASFLYALKNKELSVGETSALPASVIRAHSQVLDPSGLRSFEDISESSREDISEEIRWIVEVLKGKGCEVLIKDLTHPSIGIPVVRVLVRGLQPGLFGIGVVDLNHQVAQISKHLAYHGRLKRDVGEIGLLN